MRQRSKLAGFLLVALALLLSTSEVDSAAPVFIVPGIGIGPLTLGMRSMDVPRVLHVNATPKLSGGSVVYDFPSQGLTSWASDDRVHRVSTRNRFHRMRNGLHPTEFWSDGIIAMCAGIAVSSPIPNGVEVGCPTLGVSFDVVQGRIAAISVMRPLR